MQMLGYGEDALTLWALKQKMPDILQSLDGSTVPEDCLVFYRPSFGRRGGEERAEFGEFDFILVTKKGGLYLGESKWDNSSERKEQSIFLRDEQLRRHELFKWYAAKWFECKPRDWEQFLLHAQNDFINDFGGSKKLAPIDSILAETLRSVLCIIQAHIENPDLFKIKNVLLYLYNGNKTQPPNKINSDFQIINIDYSGHLKSGNLIEL